MKGIEVAPDRVPVEPREASTVVLLRDGREGLETLLLRRNKALAFAGGLWVFPGGAIDPQDRQLAGDDIQAAARYAAVREAQEEAGLGADPDGMQLISHWLTPEPEPKRFSTWVFAAAVDCDDDVCIDGGEIHDACWLSVAAALERHRQGELPLLPPTFVTLSRLLVYSTVSAALEGLAKTPSPRVEPVLPPGPERRLVMFSGDAGYESADPEVPGARHRASLNKGIWTFEYQTGVEHFDPLIEPLAGAAP